MEEALRSQLPDLIKAYGGSDVQVGDRTRWFTECKRHLLVVVPDVLASVVMEYAQGGYAELREEMV